ncbi:MAG: ATP synthase F0 subunit B [Syntrophobacterales bacterium]|nr:ATP synthase F0 subunit B [Syntrophobacterales bacterium]
MVELNYTFFIQAALFFALIIILNQFLYKPILSILEKRQKNFEDSENTVKNLEQTIDSKMAEYENKIQQAKMKAVDEKGEILKEGTEKAKEIIEAVRSEVPGMMDDFRKKLDAEISDARTLLDGKSKGLSVEIAEKVLGRSI